MRPSSPNVPECCSAQDFAQVDKTVLAFLDASLAAAGETGTDVLGVMAYLAPPTSPPGWSPPAGAESRSRP
jgi:hypothetical protein